MHKACHLIFPIILLLFFSGCNSKNKINQPHTKHDYTRYIGQMIIVGFHGLTSQDPEVKKLHSYIKQGYVGGVIFYKRNIKSKKQLKNLIAYLKSASTTPIFVAIDQEGGLVSKLNPQQGFAYFQSAKTVAKKFTPNQTRLHYLNMAKLQSELGFNLNFGPVADLDLGSPAISKHGRSYSRNPNKVVQYAKIFIEAHKIHNVLTCIKHFPGHGSANVDSHKRLPDITNSWSKYELIPFKKLINNNKIPMVMLGHLLHKSIDSSNPVSTSLKWINILRQDIDFPGLIITDDMYMNAIAKSSYTEANIEQACIRAIEHRVDIILISELVNKRGYGSKIYHLSPKELCLLIQSNVSDKELLVAAHRRITKVKRSITVNNTPQ